MTNATTTTTTTPRPADIPALVESWVMFAGSMADLRHGYTPNANAHARGYLALMASPASRLHGVIRWIAYCGQNDAEVYCTDVFNNYVEVTAHNATGASLTATIYEAGRVKVQTTTFDGGCEITQHGTVTMPEAAALLRWFTGSNFPTGSGW